MSKVSHRLLHDGSSVWCVAICSRVRSGGPRHHGDVAALLLADAGLGLARPARRRGRGAHPPVAAPPPGVVGLYHGALAEGPWCRSLHACQQFNTTGMQYHVADLVHTSYVPSIA